MDFDIGQEFIAYSEKHFGETTTEWVAGLVIVTIVLICLEQITIRIVVPCYKAINALIKGYQYNLKRDFSIVSGIVSLIVGGFFSIIISSLVTYPAHSELDNIKMELQKTSTDLKISQLELETYRQQMNELYKQANKENPKLDHPVQGP